MQALNPKPCLNSKKPCLSPIENQIPPVSILCPMLFPILFCSSGNPATLYTGRTAVHIHVSRESLHVSNFSFLCTKPLPCEARGRRSCSATIQRHKEMSRERSREWNYHIIQGSQEFGALSSRLAVWCLRLVSTFRFKVYGPCS